MGKIGQARCAPSAQQAKQHEAVHASDEDHGHTPGEELTIQTIALSTYAGRNAERAERRKQRDIDEVRTDVDAVRQGQRIAAADL